MRRSLIVAIALLSVGVAGLVFSQTMMGPGGYGPMMGRGGYGWGPEDGPWNAVPPGNPQALTIDQVASDVRSYLRDSGYGDLELAEVMEFSNHFYAAAKEADTGRYAFELLVNRYTGEIFPEPGPNMMWNVKYGHMGVGMMGGYGGRRGPGYGGYDSSGPMTVSPGQARETAQRYLDAQMPGATVGDDADTFYGYYTLHYLENGQVAGMLGVNGYSGDVWVHEWHGRFVRMEEYAGGHD